MQTCQCNSRRRHGVIYTKMSPEGQVLVPLVGTIDAAYLLSYSSTWTVVYKLDKQPPPRFLGASNRDAPTVDSVRLGGIVHQMQRVTMQIDGCDPYLDHFDRSSNSHVENRDTLAISKSHSKYKLGGIDEDNAGVGIYKYLLHPQTAPSILHNAATKTLHPT
jgi:hypothetical protein